MTWTWMEDQIQKCVLLSLLMIQAETRGLFLKDCAGDEMYTLTSTASHGWY